MTVPLAIMTPPASPTASPKSIPSQRSSHSSGLSLDLSSLPPLIQPSPPTNTLIITNLNNSSLFQPPTLDRIRSLVSSHHPLNSFAPIRAFCRIIISYADTDAAIQTRQMLDGASTKLFLPPIPTAPEDQAQSQEQEIYDRIRCYFGEVTPLVGVENPDQHLKAPNPGKLFFISPPPSPPCGWEIREEDPPNKETHAEDLEKALAGLTSMDRDADNTQDVSMKEAPESGDEGEDVEARRLGSGTRTRSMTVYHPKHHGSKDDLPAVIVSDMGPDEDLEEEQILEGSLDAKPNTSFTRTSRPPVELMDE